MIRALCNEWLRCDLQPMIGFTKLHDDWSFIPILCHRSEFESKTYGVQLIGYSSRSLELSMRKNDTVVMLRWGIFLIIRMYVCGGFVWFVVGILCLPRVVNIRFPKSRTKCPINGSSEQKSLKNMPARRHLRWRKPW